MFTPWLWHKLQIFSPICHLSFHFSCVFFFCRVNRFYFYLIKFIYLFSYCFQNLSHRKVFPLSEYKGIHPHFLLFVYFHFSHWELLSIWNLSSIRNKSNVIFSHMAIQLFQCHLLESVSFPMIEISLYHILIIHVSLFLAF